jgi:hypothetical protein
MKLRWGLYIATLAAQALLAGTIDVSANTVTTLQTGDSLSFQVLSSSFSRNAVAFGVSPDPTAVSFALTTAPIVGAGDFEATLQSADGATSVSFNGPLTFTDGAMSSSGYSGADSTLNGFLQLSPQLSDALFTSSPELVLTYQGPDITLSLVPYTLRQELSVSLSGGPLTVGALQGSVTLQTPNNPLFSPRSLNLPGPSGLFAGGFTTDPGVPEPDSALLSLGGGAVLCAFALFARWLARRNGPIAREKSTVCNP